ncbi:MULTISPECIES: efflux RND transporter periplasmic adaptor subunit [Pseudoalteromonas]|uniref:efflux RND transporter periplasmic adaptor subunit n=1 Tax=Pseudoalteromonas TaxID=53246 RepID=UPI0019D0AB01|nr:MULTISPECIES: efflux RND transporter periplasmic adaptor subunit [Pseudoalteromonas]MBR8844277.1 efflux RND transporter periplasmic adaptor subunit [Pseudoalteromonas sp. JC3]QUI68855.1 efflux RND transporter periplasmic adaptor subunit [Pseudoalteromonas sp. M8]QZO15090.1 efflux RND transporter periplasmic adaptor subunit [Pseudoalteromonas piscicida]WJE10939.1 efflux RND transporter periplasmic adaptor subunit [Pseudoalteromonas sp. JC3]
MKNFPNLLKVIFLLFGSVVLLVGCEQAQPDVQKQVSRPVKLFAVEQTATSSTYRYPGSVSSVKETILAFEVPGKVIDLHIKEGDFVKKGTVLAELDDRDYKAQLDSAKSDLSVVNADYQRYKKALKANAVTAQTLQQAKRNLDVALSAFNQADKALMETKLIAPFSGRIVTRDIEPFATVHAKQPIMQINSEAGYEMVVSVPESIWAQGERVKSAADINLENQLVVSLSAFPDERFEGTITEFSGQADTVTRTYKVRVAFSVPDNVSVSSGMTGHAIYTELNEQKNTLLIPLDAVVGNSDNSAFVWLYDQIQGKVTKQPITVGNITDKTAHVVSGLKSGDVIAVSGVHSLYDGYPVYPMKD